MVLDTSVRQVDEMPRPGEYLKMAANMKIVEIRQVFTAINNSIRRYRKVSFRSDIGFWYLLFGCVGLIQIDSLTFSKIKFESDLCLRASSKGVIRASLMSLIRTQCS